MLTDTVALVEKGVKDRPGEKARDADACVVAYQLGVDGHGSVSARARARSAGRRERAIGGEGDTYASAALIA